MTRPFRQVALASPAETEQRRQHAREYYRKTKQRRQLLGSESRARQKVAQQATILPKREEWARLGVLLGNPWTAAGFGVRPRDSVYGLAEVERA